MSLSIPRTAALGGDLELCPPAIRSGSSDIPRAAAYGQIDSLDGSLPTRRSLGTPLQQQRLGLSAISTSQQPRWRTSPMASPQQPSPRMLVKPPADDEFAQRPPSGRGTDRSPLAATRNCPPLSLLTLGPSGDCPMSPELGFTAALRAATQPPEAISSLLLQSTNTPTPSFKGLPMSQADRPFSPRDRHTFDKIDLPSTRSASPRSPHFSLSGLTDGTTSVQLLQRLLEAERHERLEGVAACRKDLDAQQKVLTEVAKQLIALKTESPPQNHCQKAFQEEQDHRQQLAERRLGKLEANIDDFRQGIVVQEKNQDRLREDLGVRICELAQGMSAQEQKHELLRQGLTELHLQCVALSAEASWSPSNKEKPSSEKSPDRIQGANQLAREMDDHTAAAQAATVACAAAATNMDALLEATTDLAKLLDVERAARVSKMEEMESRFSNEISEAIRLIEKRSGDFKAMFTAASKSCDKKYAKFAGEMAELWDIFEVRVREVTQRVNWLEVKKKGVGAFRCPSSGSSSRSGKCGGESHFIGDACDEGAHRSDVSETGSSDGSHSHSDDSVRTQSTCTGEASSTGGTDGSLTAVSSGSVEPAVLNAESV